MNKCIFEEFGFKSQKIFFLPVKDSNGRPKDKAFKVVVGSKFHKKLLNMGENINTIWIVED